MAFSLQDYLARIGDPETPSADLATLRRLHLYHTAAIPFENLDVLLNREIRLDETSLFTKLVTARRGGYCYEQNGLFQRALTEIGFQVRALAARVLVREPREMPPRTHRLMMIELDGDPWIADVGFGGTTLTAPLRLYERGIQTTPHGRYRLDIAGEDYLLLLEKDGQWQVQYGFDTASQYPADDEMANFYTAHFPDSHFRHHLLLGIQALDGDRKGAVNRRLTRYRQGGAERVEFADFAALYRALESEFGLGLDHPQYGIGSAEFIAMMSALDDAE